MDTEQEHQHVANIVVIRVDKIPRGRCAKKKGEETGLRPWEHHNLTSKSKPRTGLSLSLLRTVLSKL